MERQLIRHNGHHRDPRASEPVHFRDFGLSSSNQLSTHDQLVGGTSSTPRTTQRPYPP